MRIIIKVEVDGKAIPMGATAESFERAYEELGSIERYLEKSNQK